MKARPGYKWTAKSHQLDGVTTRSYKRIGRTWYRPTSLSASPIARQRNSGSHQTARRRRSNGPCRHSAASRAVCVPALSSSQGLKMAIRREAVRTSQAQSDMIAIPDAVSGRPAD